jgi:hypothetical protein
MSSGSAEARRTGRRLELHCDLPSRSSRHGRILDDFFARFVVSGERGRVHTSPLACPTGATVLSTTRLRRGAR